MLLRRWAHPKSGLIEVLDRHRWTLERLRPADFAALPDFNTVVGKDGEPDDWIEAQLLAGLDNAAAQALRQVDSLPRPGSLAKMAVSRGWHEGHIVSPRLSAAMAMWVAAQAVRSPVFRNAVTGSTTREVQRTITEHYEAELAQATDAEQEAHLRYMAGIRVVATKFDQNALPELSAQLIVRLGEVLYTEYIWTIQRFAEPCLLLGDDAVVLMNIGQGDRCGSYTQVATRGEDAVSLWLEPQEVIRRAVDAMRGNHLVLIPLGPQHLLLLTRAARVRAGRYDGEPRLATAYNAAFTAASSAWTCRLPADAAPEPTPAARAGCQAARQGRGAYADHRAHRP